MALVLHELATNAAKYGALSTCCGRLTIEWTATARELSFVWRESNGPLVVPPTRQGFGTGLFARVLAPFNARLDAKFHPSGFCCESQAAAVSRRVRVTTRRRTRRHGVVPAGAIITFLRVTDPVCATHEA